MKKVITYGTFDLLHKGHVRLLKRAKALGDHLTVCLSSDEFNAEKGKKAYTSYEDRKYILEAIKYVDEVIPETNWDQKIHDVQDRNIDVFVMGDDWEGKFDFLKDYCEVVYLPRTEGISTTKIKEDLGLTDTWIGKLRLTKPKRGCSQNKVFCTSPLLV
ncbi:glycerol-3-phosphate cytidylyltransferase [Lentilactobacillus parafarraginis F0439]|uniref:Glycerol-3-phosphate cytidylyltransferase n=1 Tax=Lentilactobacillus parafarraginis F0439 TaxID=797515 RepID=G9ZN02_9LACO|nr:glycerol-3-phosphate cytidylyltransferase [Lentilactobacillus parafarraginis F0439]